MSNEGTINLHVRIENGLNNLIEEECIYEAQINRYARVSKQNLCVKLLEEAIGSRLMEREQESEVKNG